MNKSRQVKVLICPLDWGLGHATRCIPIIREFIHLGAEVIIASDGYGFELLMNEFPDLKHIRLKGYGIKFNKLLPAATGVLLDVPRILKNIFREHKEINKLIADNHIDVLLSDNRYGLWNKNVYSIFLTHQLNIIPPAWLNYTSLLLRKATRFIIEKYNECWIPDVESEPSLSGKLSHKGNLPFNSRYIGYLSRFDAPCPIAPSGYEVIAILSGPEPHRTQLEELLTIQLSQLSKRSLLLRGITGTSNNASNINNLTIIDHLNSKELCSLLMNKPVVICRGGYSTLMDLAFTGNRIICIPTPGQTEQEYLATYGALTGRCLLLNQKEFSISDALQKIENANGIPLASDNLGYKHHVRRIIQQFH